MTSGSEAMNFETAKRARIFYLYIILFHSLNLRITTGIYFKLIAGKDEWDVNGNTASIIREEFFQCGRDKSCTHVMKLVSGYKQVNNIVELEERKHEAVFIYEKIKLMATSCLDFYYDGMQRNGRYEALDHNGILFQIFCDFESEAKSVWTLVASYSLQQTSHFYLPFYKSSPINASMMNWVDYRLGLPRMKGIRSSSTMWRVTCSFPKYKSDIYRDYLRVELNQVDILQFDGWGECCYVNHINIRGHEGRNVTVPFWQGESTSIHVDSSKKPCQFDARQGSVYDEDNFGFYGGLNSAFRCTESNASTTQYWFGRNV